MKANDEVLQSARYIAYGETLLIVFPFIIIGLLIIYGYKDLTSLLYTSDWSLAGSILAGQTIVRYTAGMIKYEGKKRWQVISLETTALFCVAALCLVTHGVYNSHENPPLTLAITQIILFIVSLLVFIFYGSAGQALLDNSNK